ncbi:MAG TPA: response regulator transcription factor [Candidatus Borkfalkia excrementigallinarum]|uniref:Stage 0 sporulation protein A homolog n=1 Tax=Candidatus Borkfalkia excrementigallinarum TaxID=2838506 RepID=A0A9D2CSA8_9FIRM|nr:response regulator transcription factor [Candidatus Borkfalkia excrementigallinarum]
MKIKVMIVDDQVILSEGIRSVLASSDELDVIATAADGKESLELMEQGKVPDVVLLDIRMPNMNGVVTTGEIKKRFPDVKILILTTFDDSDYILSALNNGACGYLLKDISAPALIDSIKNAYAGDTILPAKIAKKITDAAKMVTSDRELKLRKAFGLSDREVEIAVMIYEGFNNRQIASALNLSDGTARNYISAIYLKLGCDGRADAIAKMRETLGA